MLGHAVTLPPLDFRYAAEHELETDGAGPDFSCAETPVIIYGAWTMNLAEYFRCGVCAVARARAAGADALPASGALPSSVPLTLHTLKEKGAHLDAATLVQFVPEKLPLEGFNRWMLQPFSPGREPTSLAEFSAMKTQHGNCFAEVILLKARGAARRGARRGGAVGRALTEQRAHAPCAPRPCACAPARRSRAAATRCFPRLLRTYWSTTRRRCRPRRGARAATTACASSSSRAPTKPCASSATLTKCWRTATRQAQRARLAARTRCACAALAC